MANVIDNGNNNFGDDAQSIRSAYEKAKMAKMAAQKLFKKKVIVAVASSASALFLPLLILFLVFFCAAPFNSLRYGDEVAAVGSDDPRLTVNTPGFEISPDEPKYDFLISMYNLKSGFEKLAFDIMHPIQATEVNNLLDAVEKKLGPAGIILPEINVRENADGTVSGSDYTRAVTSAVTTMNSAFQHGWAQTWGAAEYRAKKIKSQNTSENGVATTNIVDEYFDSTKNNDKYLIWSSERDFWSQKEKWDKDGKNFYPAGEFKPAFGTEYVNTYIGEKNVVNISYKTLRNDDEQPIYLAPELYILSYQNALEQSVKGNLKDNDGLLTGDLNDYGIVIDYGDAGIVPNIKSTQYQLLRLAGEVAGKGILTNDIDKHKDVESIYLIETAIDKTVTPQYQEVKRRYIDHFEDVEVGKVVVGYEQKKVNVLVGSGPLGPIFEERWVDDKTKPIYEILYENRPVYAEEYDHTDVWCEVNVTVSYNVKLQKDLKGQIENTIKNTLLKSDEDKVAFDLACIDYFDMHCKLLFEMFQMSDPELDFNGHYDGDLGNGLIIPGGFSWPLADGGHYVRGFTGSHKGIDWAQAYGTPIYAVADGVVEISRYHNSWGNHVKIAHNNPGNISTNYAHMSKRLVAEGQAVTQGQVIGLVGSTGNSTGNHLHFEVWLNGKRVNPRPYLNEHFADKFPHE